MFRTPLPPTVRGSDLWACRTDLQHRSFFYLTSRFSLGRTGSQNLVLLTEWRSCWGASPGAAPDGAPCCCTPPSCRAPGFSQQNLSSVRHIICTGMKRNRSAARAAAEPGPSSQLLLRASRFVRPGSGWAPGSRPPPFLSPGGSGRVRPRGALLCLQDHSFIPVPSHGFEHRLAPQLVQLLRWFLCCGSEAAASRVGGLIPHGLLPHRTRNQAEETFPVASSPGNHSEKTRTRNTDLCLR